MPAASRAQCMVQGSHRASTSNQTIWAIRFNPLPLNCRTPADKAVVEIRWCETAKEPTRSTLCVATANKLKSKIWRQRGNGFAVPRRPSLGSLRRFVRFFPGLRSSKGGHPTAQGPQRKPSTVSLATVPLFFTLPHRRHPQPGPSRVDFGGRRSVGACARR